MDDNELLRRERKKYMRIWTENSYREYSPECQKIWDIIPWLKHKPVTRVLDIGCGPGFGMHWLDREGFSVEGFWQ